MSYQALYRKWRPQVFADVKGQDHYGNILISLDLGKLKNRRLGHTADRLHLLGKAIDLRE